MQSETMSTIILIATSTLRMSVPIVLGAIGAAMSRRAGVDAFGCEGMMITGAFCGVLGAILTGNNWIGLLFAVAGGMLISLLHAFLHVTHKVNATLSGICINLIGVGLTELLLKVIWDSNMYSPDIKKFDVVNPDWLVRIPVIGQILGNQYIIFWIAIVLVILCHLFLYKTSYGLRMRMVGDSPVAANSVGINTVRYKYFGVLACGALSGLGGAYLSMASLSCFQTNMTAGRGYISMVACNLAKSNPLGAALGSLFFGFFDSLQIMLQGVEFPSQILMMMPYVFTLIAATISIGKSRGPAGIGKHYDED